jgi:hypothetical protein
MNKTHRQNLDRITRLRRKRSLEEQAASHGFITAKDLIEFWTDMSRYRMLLGDNKGAEQALVNAWAYEDSSVR